MKSWLWLITVFLAAFHVNAGELQDAAGAGDIAKVRALIRANPALIHQRDGGTTALHEAARAGRLEVVKFLVASGANVNAQDFSKLTPLKLALGHRRTEVAEFLRQNGGLEQIAAARPAAPAAQAPSQPPSTLFATNVAVIPSIPATPAPQSVTPAPAAGGSGASTAPAKSPGTDPTAVAKEPAPLAERDVLTGVFPIHELARVGDVEQIKVIYKAAPDVVDATDEHGLTALHVAAAHKQLAVARTLIGLRAKVNVKAENGQTPLHLAARNGDQAMVALLLTNRAIVDARDNLGQTPLLVVLQSASAAVPPGGTTGSDRSRSPDEFKQAVARARADAIKAKEPVVNQLLRAGAEVNLVEARTGKTPLHLVADLGHTALVKEFLRRGARADAPDVLGETPLGYALRQGQTNVVAALRSAGGTIGRSRSLDATERSLVDFYLATEQALQRASAADKARILAGLNPTATDCKRMFPKHASAAENVVGQVNRLIREEFSRPRPDAEQGREIWRVLPGSPSALVQEWRTRGMLATDLPVYSLTVEKVGTTTRPGDYCFVNGRWVMMPPLSTIAAQMAEATLNRK